MFIRNKLIYRYKRRRKEWRMKDIPLKIYSIQIIITLALLAVIVQFNQSKISDKYKGSIREFNNGWSYEDGKERKSIDVASKQLKWQAGKTLVLYNKLPENIVEGYGIAFFTMHQNVEVYADNSLIYSFKVNDNSDSKTPGNGWNFVSIPRMFYGKELKICLTSNYQLNAGMIPGFKLGTKTLLLNDVLNKNLLTLSIAITVFVIGIGMCIIYLTFRKVYELDESFLCAGVLTLLLGVWSVVETQILPIYLGNQYAFTQLSFLSLALIPYPYIRFVRLTYAVENYPLQDITEIIVQVLTTIVFSLAFFKIADFKDTVSLIHISIGLTSVVMFLVIVKKIRSLEQEQIKLGIFHLFCLGAMCICIAIELIEYYFKDKKVDFFIIGPITVLMVIFTNMRLRNALRLVRVGKEAEKIKKIAYNDVLTNLKNRAAYTKQVNEISKEELVKYGIAMMDLNNLKDFNDVYGHSMGDYYIIICSEIMYDVFSSHGNIFRMGGDEFCALLKECSVEEYKKLAIDMNRKLAKLKVPNTKIHMGISIGYAKFDVEIDEDLLSTMNRADEIMYHNKQKVKRA